jgi:hypothetical protein
VAGREGKEAAMTFRGKPRDPSRPMLDQVQSDLNRTIDELCNVSDVKDESTGELERLSDQLLDAARRAHVAAELRKSIKQRTMIEHLKRRHGTELEGGEGVVS